MEESGCGVFYCAFPKFFWGKLREPSPDSWIT
jgi:hypothetical protein